MKLKKWEEKIKREYSKYKATIYTYDFQQYETIKYFDENVYTGKINIDEAEMDQSILLKIWQNSIANLDQEQWKVEIKKRYL